MEPQKPSEIPPLEALLVIIVTFFVAAFAGVFILVTLGDEATLILGELLIMLVPLIYLLYRHFNIRENIRISANPKFVLIGGGCAGLLLLLNIAVSNGLTAIFGVSHAVEDSNSLITGLSASPMGLVAVAVSLALAGICEEFAFRGFLQNSIFKALHKNPKYTQYSSAVAVVVSAGVFGLFHFDPQFVYIIATFVAGLALGGIYHKWGYTASATAHVAMNLLVLALLLSGF